MEDQDESHYGGRGSATQVETIFEPEKISEKKVYNSGDLANDVYEILKDRKFI